MNVRLTFTTVCTILSAASFSFAAGAFYGDPPDANHPWAIHDMNRPQPKVVKPGTSSTPAQPGKPPSDATILFDGTEKTLSNWLTDKDGSPTKWIVKDGAMECVPKSGYTRTKAEFGDCQLHVEWAAPAKPEGESQGRGNSGIFLMGVECQVLDNFENQTYADGYACSIYGVRPPLANALRPPGQWQFIDIVFRSPVYKGEQVLDPGYVTVFCNGVLVQDHTQIEGPTGHMKRTKPGAFPEKGALKLQDHGNPVRFRNIWYRELPARSVEGGTDGPLSAEATMAKRKEIATTIREDAAKLTDPLSQLLRYMESVYYEKDEPTWKKVEQMTKDYVGGIEKLEAGQVASKKDDIMRLNAALGYMVKHKFVEADYAPKAAIQKIIKQQGWDKKGKK